LLSSLSPAEFAFLKPLPDQRVFFDAQQIRHHLINTFLDCMISTIAIIPSPKGTAQIEPIIASPQFVRFSETIPPKMDKMPRSAGMVRINNRLKMWGAPKPTDNPIMIRKRNASPKSQIIPALISNHPAQTDLLLLAISQF
jgi:hypothetical protein